jgi:RsiW-degrading membrane proteinase PrsW (M82 family)
MSLTCNIDARGKATRLRIGIIGLFIGAALLFAWALPTGGTLPWLITTGVLVGAAFSVFEARAGWCVVRAMGFHTRL